jgi:hypothetical protein
MLINRPVDIELGVHPDDHREHKWAFTTEIVEKLKPTLGSSQSLFAVSGETWESTCRISPGIVATQWETWLADGDKDLDSMFLNSVEVDYVIAISTMISKLTAGQLRALGTHRNPEATLADIQFNARSWLRRFRQVQSTLEQDLAVASDISTPAYQLVTTSREIYRKAFENKKDYKDGRLLALQSCPSEDIVAVVSNIQKDDATIWERGAIPSIVPASLALLNFSIYIRCGLHQLHLVKILNAREIDEATEAYKKLHRPFPNVFPDLPKYEDITKVPAKAWGSKLNKCMTTIFAFLGNVQSNSEYGVP